MLGALLAMALTASSAQFGTASVQWQNSNPTVGESPPLKDIKTPEGSRRSGLHGLSVESLTAIMEDGFSKGCEGCAHKGHWVSRIRSECLALGPKGIKQQLVRRGIKCTGCSSREHYLDRLLDVVHLPLKTSALGSAA